MLANRVGKQSTTKRGTTCTIAAVQQGKLTLTQLSISYRALKLKRVGRRAAVDVTTWPSARPKKKRLLLARRLSGRDDDFSKDLVHHEKDRAFAAEATKGPPTLDKYRRIIF